jgi:hypothetical protein
VMSVRYTNRRGHPDHSRGDTKPRHRHASINRKPFQGANSVEDCFNLLRQKSFLKGAQERGKYMFYWLPKRPPPAHLLTCAMHLLRITPVQTARPGEPYFEAPEQADKP